MRLQVSSSGEGCELLCKDVEGHLDLSRNLVIVPGDVPQLTFPVLQHYDSGIGHCVANRHPITGRVQFHLEIACWHAREAAEPAQQHATRMGDDRVSGIDAAESVREALRWWWLRRLGQGGSIAMCMLLVAVELAMRGRNHVAVGLAEEHKGSIQGRGFVQPPP